MLFEDFRSTNEERMEIAKLLVEDGAGVNAKNKSGMTPFVFCVSEWQYWPDCIVDRTWC